MEKRVAIIIPFYQGNKYLAKCLNSIKSSIGNTDRIKVFIIKNDYEEIFIDSTIDMDVEVVHTNPKIGFARASNLGVYLAKYNGFKNYIIQNQDSHWIGNALELFINRILKYPDAYHSPLLYDYNSDIPNLSFLKNYIYKSQPEFKKVDLTTYTKKIKVLNVAAACIGFSESLLNLNALFDPIFYHYGEDFDFFNRTQPDLFVWPICKLGHIDGDSTSRDLSRQVIQLGIARIKKDIRFRGLKSVFKNYIGLMLDGITYYKSVSICLGITRGLFNCLKDRKALVQYDRKAVLDRILFSLRLDNTLSHDDHFTESIFKH